MKTKTFILVEVDEEYVESLGGSDLDKNTFIRKLLDEDVFINTPFSLISTATQSRLEV